MDEQVFHDRSRAVIRVLGEDAEHFLQGLITNTLPKGAEWVYAGLLTPQGKLIADFFVTRFEDGFYLDVPASECDGLVKRLGLYKLRAKVEISKSDLVVLLSPEGAIKNAVFAASDPRHKGLGQRALAKSPEGLEDVTPYHALRFKLGVPLGGVDFAYNDAFSHEANMDLLHGIHFKKGCYVGQEVVSRVHHKGGARKRVLPVSLSKPVEAPQPVMLDGATVGSLTSAMGVRGFAELRLDRAHKAIMENLSLMAGEVEITLLKPDWMSLPFPGEPEFEGRA